MSRNRDSTFKTSVPSVRPVTIFFVYLVTLTLFCVALQLASHGYEAERGNHSDEAAHFISSKVITDYLKTKFQEDPVTFAKDYYSHYPKVAIGHWPPFFETLQAVIFYFCGSTSNVAIIFQALVAGMVLALTATLVTVTIGVVPGIASAAIILFSPSFMAELNMVMADNLLSLMVTLTALSWSNYYQKQSWPSCLLLATVASLTLLTKGTAVGLLLMPFIYLAMKRDLNFLLNTKTISCGIIVGAVTIPWYAFTYQMAADGFVFSWGWDYTRQAIPFFTESIFGSIGLPCSLLFLFYAYLAVRRSNSQEPEIFFIDGAAFVSASLSMLLFITLAPADLDKRYLVACLPSLAICAVLGASFIGTHAARYINQPSVSSVFLVVLIAFSIWENFQFPHPRSFHTKEIVSDILTSGLPNRLILVSGGVESEGAFISSFAETDQGRRYYIIRAQKALATTNWMASDYASRFTKAEDLSSWIRASKIGWIVQDDDSLEADFPHNKLLKLSLTEDVNGAKLVAVVSHPGGTMSLFSLPAAATNADISEGVFLTSKPGHLGEALK